MKDKMLQDQVGELDDFWEAVTTTLIFIVLLAGAYFTWDLWQDKKGYRYTNYINVVTDYILENEDKLKTCVKESNGLVKIPLVDMKTGSAFNEKCNFENHDAYTKYSIAKFENKYAMWLHIDDNELKIIPKGLDGYVVTDIMKEELSRKSNIYMFK